MPLARHEATQQALRTAREVIASVREADFSCFTVSDNPATMDEHETRLIAEYDAALALIDAVLPEPPKELT